MSTLVIDIETKNDFRDVGGKMNIQLLQISVVGVYDYETGRLYAYQEHEFGELKKLLSRADRLIGYNIVGFDMPILQAAFTDVPLSSIPATDIMYDIMGHIGHRIGLKTVVKATLGKGGKLGSGMDAIRFWKEGKMEELKAYCLRDVELTRDVYEFGKREKNVYFEGWQRKYAVPVKWT